MLIREYPIKVVSGTVAYTARILGDERPDGSWEGWIEFRPTDSNHPILSTERETSQPTLAALEYWSYGLEPVYLEGALARAQGRLL